TGEPERALRSEDPHADPIGRSQSRPFREHIESLLCPETVEGNRHRAARRHGCSLLVVGVAGRRIPRPADLDLATRVRPAVLAHPVRQARLVAARATIDRRLAGLVLSTPLVTASAGSSL